MFNISISYLRQLSNGGQHTDDDARVGVRIFQLQDQSLQQHNQETEVQRVREGESVSGRETGLREATDSPWRVVTDGQQINTERFLTNTLDIKKR